MPFYPSIPAGDGTSLVPPANALFQVYELTDADFTTPLPLTTSSGLNAAPLITTAQGVVPPVNVTSPNLSHIFKSGSWEWRRDSFDGAAKAVEDARAAAEAAVAAAEAPTDESVDRGIARADLPKLAADAVGSSPTVTAAAAAAVGNALDGADVVRGTARGRTTEAAGGFIGENDRLTDLVFDEDGEVPDFVLLDRWAPRLGVTDVVKGSVKGYTSTAAGGFVGDNDRLTELVVDSNGNVPTSVLDRWASRMNLGSQTPTPGVNPFASTLPIVAIGDSQTGEVHDNVRWPEVMGAALGLKAEQVRNCGFPGETSVAIAAKMGAVPAVWPAGGTIPASGYVEVILKDHVDMMRWWAAMPCTLAGVPGTLSRNPSQPGTEPSTSFPARFTRTTPGTAVTVPPNAPFVPQTLALRGCMSILMVGRNNTSDPVRVRSDTRAIVEQLTALDGKYLVLSQINGQATGINTLLAQDYGPRYLDVGKYLTSAQALTDSKITPTQADLDAVAGKQIPPSFLADGTHLNGVGLTLQGNFVAQHLIGKAWL